MMVLLENNMMQCFIPFVITVGERWHLGLLGIATLSAESVLYHFIVCYSEHSVPFYCLL